jgi:phosphinothricin acetyltransferase
MHARHARPEDAPDIAASRVLTAFAATFAYRPRACYAGIVLEAPMVSASAADYWKLVSRIFVENMASRRLVASLGFREVGIYERHGRLDGVWRDVVIVERLLSGGTLLDDQSPSG